jgi:hypothetical protein
VSTKSTVKHHYDPDGSGFHVWTDFMDECVGADVVHVRFDHVWFEASSPGTVEVTLSRDMAERLGIIEPPGGRVCQEGDVMTDAPSERERLWRAGWDAGRDASTQACRDVLNGAFDSHRDHAEDVCIDAIAALTPPQSPATPPGHVLVPVSGPGFDVMVERALDETWRNPAASLRRVLTGKRAALGEHGDAG